MFYQSLTKALTKYVCCALHPDVHKSLCMCVWAATLRGVGTWAAAGPNNWHHRWCNSLAWVLMAPPRWLAGSADEVFLDGWKECWLCECVCDQMQHICWFHSTKGPMASLRYVHLSQLLSKLFHDCTLSVPHFYLVSQIFFFFFLSQLFTFTRWL